MIVREDMKPASQTSAMLRLVARVRNRVWQRVTEHVLTLLIMEDFEVLHSLQLHLFSYMFHFKLVGRPHNDRGRHEGALEAGSLKV